MKTSKKILSLALAIIIAVGSTSAFAASFTDIKNHWAKPYIEKGKELGLINGYENGEFRPESSISRIETLSLIPRILDLPQSETDKALEKYEDVLMDHNIISWARPELAVALSKGIIDTNILSMMKNDNGANSNSSREEVVVYLVKAMGLNNEVRDWKSNKVLSFNDRDKITPEAVPYIGVLQSIGILNGDNLGNLNPLSEIKRSEISKLITESYSYVQENKKKDNVINISGELANKFSANNKNYIEIKDEYGNSKNYEVSVNSVLKIDNKLVDYKDLNLGYKVNAEVIKDEDGKLDVIKSLTVENNVEKLTGTIYGVNSYSKQLTLEYKRNSIKHIKQFYLASDAEITLDGSRANISQLKEKDKAEIEVVNDKITKITAEANIREIKGVLKEIDIKKNYITVQDKDGNKANYDLDKNVNIRRSGYRSELKDLRKGDEVEIYIEDNMVLKIDAKIIKSEIKGIVRGKNIRVDRREITVLNTETDKEETYVIQNDVDILLGDKRAKLDDVGIGFYVIIDLEGEEIIEIYAEPTTLANEHLGTITMARGRSYFDMRLESGKIIEVIIDTDDIRDRTGKTISYRALQTGDKVLVTGEIFADELIADKIMILN